MTVFAGDGDTPVRNSYARRGSWARALAVSASVFAILGVLAGWVWSSVAVPPEFMLYRPGNAYYASEAEFAHAFEMDVAFAVTGAVAAVVGGLVVGWCFWNRGWAVSLLAAVAAIGAGFLALWLGTQLGPQSVADSAAAARRGDTFTGPVDLGARSILLVWPILALVGVILAVWLRAPRDEIVYGPDANTGNSRPEVDVQRP